MRAAPSLEDFREAAALRTALRRFHRRTEEVTRAHGLTEQRYRLLLHVKALDGAATATQLVEPLGVGQSAVAQLLARTERLGLVFRVAVTGDARVSRILLTEEGERRLRAVFDELGPDRERLLAILADGT